MTSTTLHALTVLFVWATLLSSISAAQQEQVKAPDDVWIHHVFSCLFRDTMRPISDVGRR